MQLNYSPLIMGFKFSASCGQSVYSGILRLFEFLWTPATYAEDIIFSASHSLVDPIYFRKL